jgi:hypothetical protein
VLETLDIRKEQSFYKDLMRTLYRDYGNFSEDSKFYELFSIRLSTIKDEPRWCGDEKEGFLFAG